MDTQMEAVVVDGHDLEQMADQLLERARQEGRRWGSVSEAAEWLYGAGKNTGDFWYTAREVIYNIEWRKKQHTAH